MRIALATPDEWDAPPETALSSFARTTFTPWRAARRGGSVGARLATRRSARVAPAGRRATPVEQVSITLADGRPILGRMLTEAWFSGEPNTFVGRVPFPFNN
jgi:hypothetical protein